MHPFEPHSALHPEFAHHALPAHTEGHHAQEQTGPLTQTEPIPEIGQIVHFVLTDVNHCRHPGEHRPAVIVNVWGQIPRAAVQLQVFTDGTNDYLPEHPASSGMMWKASVPYSEKKEPGTWHYPEQNERLTS